MAAPASPLHRELVVFVGKGGVGKTTTSAAAALRLAATGRRTLLVTVDPAQRLKDVLGVPVGHRVKQVRPHLDAMMLDPARLVEDWLREHVPDQDLTRHPLYKYVSNYLPGANELLGIGQLIEMRRERDYETIVIDTAPTGHALSFLTTPMKLQELLQENLVVRWAARGYSLYRTMAKGGRALRGLWADAELPPPPDIDPTALLQDLSRDVGAIHELLRDRKRTSLAIVTHPEKVAVDESLELNTYLHETLGIRPALLVVNRMPPAFDARRANALARSSPAIDEALGPGGADALTTLVRFTTTRHEEATRNVERLRKSLPGLALATIPLQGHDVTGLTSLDSLGELLEASIKNARRNGDAP